MHLEIKEIRHYTFILARLILQIFKKQLQHSQTHIHMHGLITQFPQEHSQRETDATIAQQIPRITASVPSTQDTHKAKHFKETHANQIGYIPVGLGKKKSENQGFIHILCTRFVVLSYLEQQWTQRLTARKRETS